MFVKTYFCFCSVKQIMESVDENNTEHTTNGTMQCVKEVFAPTSEAKIVPVVFAAIFVLGLVGNGIVILTVLRNKQMRNIPNILIVSLALGDFLLILVAVPFAATIYTFNEWPYGNFGCKLNEFLQTVSLGVSVYTLTVLSWDRYTAIAHPMSKQKGNPHRRTVLIAIVIWVASFGLAAVDLVVYREIKHTPPPETNNTCVYAFCMPFSIEEFFIPTWRTKSYSMTRFVIYFLLPVFTIGGFYIALASSLIASSRSLPCEQQRGAVGPAAKQLRARRKVAKVVLSFVAVFAACWLPRHAYMLSLAYTRVHLGSEFWHVFKILSFCLCFINSCANPIALCLLSGQFRRYFKQYLCCCCPALQQDTSRNTMIMYSSIPANRQSKNTAMTETVLD